MTENSKQQLWLTFDEIFEMHKGAVRDYGGLDGLRDRGLLESALGRPQNLAAYGAPSVTDLAASYAEGISRNHAFIDGNKRTAFLAADIFLDRNGYSITANALDMENMIVDLAEGKIGRTEMASFLEQNTSYDASRDYRLQRSSSLEHGASRGVGAASLAVNLAEGDVVGASVDAASMVADNNGVQKAVVTATTKALGAELVEAGLKKIPVVGAIVTVGTVLYASGAQAMDGNYKLAAGELAAGIPEAAGNIVGFGLGDAAREAARQGLIVAGGDEFAAVEKSGLRQLGEGAYALGEQAYSNMTAPQGQPLDAVLPANYRSMTLGSDAMGDRSDVGRIAIERSGLAANDPRNNLTVLSSDIKVPRAHLFVLPDGSVQGPESGGVAFGNNPSIAAGVNGGTLGIMYAGTGAMNDAQYATVKSTTQWLTEQRGREGLTSPVEVIAGSLNTAQILQIPTPQGFTPGVVPEPGTQGPSTPAQQRKLSNGTNGP